MVSEVQPAVDPEFDAARYSGLRMLAVDDEEAFVTTYQRFFGRRGFQVDTATSLSQFEDRLRDCHHHIILLDYYLEKSVEDGVIDGEHLMRLIDQYDRDASVVVVTGRPSLDGAVISLRQRAFDYLTKPIRIEELAAAVDRALEAKGLIRLSASQLQQEIGQRIRDARKELSLTLSQLSERTGLSVGFLSQIELGKNSASVETLYRIACALSKHPSDFLPKPT